jgi:hypothetical protein
MSAVWVVATSCAALQGMCCGSLEVVEAAAHPQAALAHEGVFVACAKAPADKAAHDPRLTLGAEPGVPQLSLWLHDSHAPASMRIRVRWQL